MESQKKILERVIIIYQILNIYENSSIDKDNLGKVKIQKNEQQNKVKYGDIFFTTSSETIKEVGMSSVLLNELENTYLNSFCFGYRLHNFQVLRPEFAQYLFRSIEIRRFISLLGQGSTRFNLPKTKLISNLEIEIPNCNIQTAIAHILSTVDKAIAQTKKLIAKYKRIKTGLMQDLLTKGIDENGNVRSEKTHKFKDSPRGRIPVEWELVNLDNKKYFELATGGTPSTSKREYWDNGTIPWLSSGEVHNKKIKNTATKITLLGMENSNARFYPIGSVLIALAGQGKTRGTVAITEIETTSNQSISAIIPNQELFTSYFLYHQLDFRYEELRSISSGSGRAGLSLRILKTIQVIYTDINEQKEIIKRLNQIDDFLNSNYKSLSKLSLLKSGLMQDLLTGKVRVPEKK